MKHILIIIFIISGWAASAQVKFTQMERDTVKWTIPVAHRSIPGIAGYVMKYLSYSDLLDSLGVTADSIYISGDTIYLRDGTGFIKLAAGWGLDVSTSGNTVTYKADTSKLATLTDIGGFFTLPTFTAGSVIFSNGTTLAQDNSNLFWDDANNELWLGGVAAPEFKLGVNNGRLYLSRGVWNEFINGGNNTLTGGGNVAIGSNQTLTSITSGYGNLAIGVVAGQNLTTGANNVFLGYLSGNSLVSGNDNMFIGVGAGYINTGNGNAFIGANVNYGGNGSYNSYIGYLCAYLATGSYNIAMGYYNSFGSSNTGQHNVVLGNYASQGGGGDFNIKIGYVSGVTNTGSYNVFIGPSSGMSASSGSYNVFIGNEAGRNESGSNKLYISNSSTSTPLIYGDFSTTQATINGGLTVTDRSGTPQYNAAFNSAGKLVSTGAAAGSGTVTSIATTSPITGGTITSTGTIGIDNAAADGATKGASTYTAADFNSSSGLISLDYTNGQAASGSTKGFLSSTDWTTFNNKGNGTVTSVGLTAGSGINISGTNPITSSGTMTISGTRLYPWDSGLWVSGDLYLRTNNTGTYPTITYSGGTIYYNLPSASSGQVLKYNGTGWAAGTDNTGTGVTSVTASSPLFSSGGTTPNITIQSASGSQNGSLTSSDWTAFNNKMDAFYVAASGTAGVGVVGPLDQLTITAGTGITATRSLRNITVSSTVTNTDNQTLSWSSPNLSISGGNSVALPILPSGSVNQTLRHDGSNWVASSLLKTGSSNFVDINSWPGTVISGSKLLVNGYLQYTASGYSATSLSGQDTYGGLTGVTVGSGLSLSSGTLSSTATGTVTSIATNNGITGGTITSSGTIGLTGQALAVHNLSSNGLIARTSSGNVSARTITAGTGISVSNGDGVSGNPTISTLQSEYGEMYDNNTFVTLGSSYASLTNTNTSLSTGWGASSNTGIIVPVAGYYDISFTATVAGGAGAGTALIKILNNGSTITRSNILASYGASEYASISKRVIEYCSASAVISVQGAYDPAGTNCSVGYKSLVIRKL